MNGERLNGRSFGAAGKTISTTCISIPASTTTLSGSNRRICTSSLWIEYERLSARGGDSEGMQTVGGA
jgi:hypothetical protein